MYSLDVNFLKDRKLVDAPKKNTFSTTTFKTNGIKPPIIAGLAFMVLAPAGALGFLFGLNVQKEELEKSIQQLTAQIQETQNQTQKIQTLQGELTAAQGETGSFTNVFTQIKPWSAILQDVSDRIPPGVQVDSISQIESPAADPAKPPVMSLTIKGVARSYNDVNDFMLFLQRSDFLNSKKTFIQGVDTTELETSFKGKIDTKRFTVEVPLGVKYTISTQINDTPSSTLIRELTNKGAIGLVTRLRTLEQKGAIK
jgi:type IV pilus assembly protein PilN